MWRSIKSFIQQDFCFHPNQQFAGQSAHILLEFQARKDDRRNSLISCRLVAALLSLRHFVVTIARQWPREQRLSRVVRPSQSCEASSCRRSTERRKRFMCGLSLQAAGEETQLGGGQPARNGRFARRPVCVQRGSRHIKWYKVQQRTLKL